MLWPTGVGLWVQTLSRSPSPRITRAHPDRELSEFIDTQQGLAVAVYGVAGLRRPDPSVSRSFRPNHSASVSASSRTRWIWTIEQRFAIVWVSGVWANSSQIYTMD